MDTVIEWWKNVPEIEQFISTEIDNLSYWEKEYIYINDDIKTVKKEYKDILKPYTCEDVIKYELNLFNEKNKMKEKIEIKNEKINKNTNEYKGVISRNKRRKQKKEDKEYEFASSESEKEEDPDKNTKEIWEDLTFDFNISKYRKGNINSADYNSYI